MRVAVLGSNSFAGCDFVDLLLESGRFDVLGISRSPEKPAAFLPYANRSRERFVYRQLDINAEHGAIAAELDAFAPEFVINFAAQGDEAASWAYPADFFQTNCVALARLVDGLKARTYVRRFLQISSSSVYGAPAVTVTESSPLAPRSPYAVSKTAADLLLLAYFENFDFPAQIMRLPNLYGPYQQLYRLVPKSMIQIRRGGVIELHGGGYAMRSYLHIRDASRAALAILERGRAGEVYNVSPDDVHRIRDLVMVVCELLGRDFSEATREVEDRRGQSSVTRFDSSKIRRELGWRPQVPLRAGIAGVGAWLEKEWDSLMGEQLDYIHQA